MALVFDQDEEITAWVAARSGGGVPPPSYSAIGYERNGRLVAGVYFEGVTDTNLFAHIASDGAYMPLDLLIAVSYYAFHQLQVRRMTFMVADNNDRALALVSALGAEYEASIREGHAEGDVHLFAYWETSKFHQKLMASGRLPKTTHGQ